MVESAQRLEGRFYRGEREEQGIGRIVEAQTQKIPMTGFLGLAVGSMLVSAALEFFGRNENTRHYGNFVGLWAPSFLLMGIYSRISGLRPEEWRRER